MRRTKFLAVYILAIGSFLIARGARADESGCGGIGPGCTYSCPGNLGCNAGCYTACGVSCGFIGSVWTYCSPNP